MWNWFFDGTLGSYLGFGLMALLYLAAIYTWYQNVV